MNNRYRIYTEYNFAAVKFDPGVKTFEEIFQIAKEFREDKDFKLVNYLLTDLRDCTFNFDRNKINDLAPLLKKYKEIDNQKLGVYVVNKPIETAYVQLFFESIENERKLCSTIEKAYSILDISIPFLEFLSIIDI